jgi:phage terminase small subunit
MNSQGSVWRKWNFHIHTKGTTKNDQFTSSSMDDFFCVFFKKAFESQISAIGITDYFSIERYIEAIEYRKNISTKLNLDGRPAFSDNEINFINQIFIFPNVELRMLPSTDRGRLINIHCLFNPDYVFELENDFFGHVSNQDGYKMNKHGITQYGKSLDQGIIDVNKQFKKGIDNFVIDLKTLKELRDTNKKFRNNSLLVVSNSNNDGASAIQKHYDLFENENGSLDGLRKSIYYISDAIFSSNTKDIKYFIGKRLEGTEGFNEILLKKEIEEVINQRGSLKPCIVGCDAHVEKDLFCKFTWIKSDLTFEGLRQIAFEPEQRVKIQNEKPDFKEDKLIIEKVKFISPNKIFSSKPILLNPNLNVIIGGKSSGKSILLYSIAKTLVSDDSILKNDDNSYKYDLTKIEPDFDFEITTKGGFSQLLNRNSAENSILPEIKYIPQNYLVKLAEPELTKKGKSLNKIVRDLIIEDEDSKKIYQEFLTKVKQNDKLRNSQIDLFFELSDEIKTLEVELKGKSNKDVLEKNIKNNLSKIEELNKGIGLNSGQLLEYNRLQNEIEDNKINLNKFKQDFALLEAFIAEYLQIMKNLQIKKDETLNSLQLKVIKDHYSPIFSKIDEVNSEVIKLSNEISVSINADGKRYFNNDNILKIVLNGYAEDGRLLNESIKPYLKNEEVKKLIEDLNQSVSADKKMIQDIDDLSKKISEKKVSLKLCKEEIFKIYNNSYSQYINIIDSLKTRTIDLEKDGLSILGKAQFNFPKLCKELVSTSDGRSASFKQYDILSGNRKATDETIIDYINTQLNALFDDIVNGKYVISSRTSKDAAIKVILNDYFFDYWEIKYKNDKLGEMSTGKASFVILMLIIGLSTSKAPILIDQPEDNLDNRSITTDLVNYLRNKKTERQIILVTHNANVVVNADAENVIIANQVGQNDIESTSKYKFDYINGAIENSYDRIVDELDVLKSMGIRQHLADIVEGGKEAFIKREKKYRFN